MADEITLKIVLDHVMAMEQRLSTQIGRVEQKLVNVEAKLSWQIDAIDKRLDEIEIESLPNASGPSRKPSDDRDPTQKKDSAIAGMAMK